ncbi:MAG: hypothetical protein VKJ64_19220 [Leptolyngbyaceae bacterium]|nr:hypothetical protein [Leptolyngbyaceae bacterium]
MTSTTYQLPLTFEQILTLVKQLPPDEKQQLSQELAKDLIDSKLSDLLTTFHTDDLSLDTITAEVEAVRGKRHAQQSLH